LTKPLKSLIVHLSTRILPSAMILTKNEVGSFIDSSTESQRFHITKALSFDELSPEAKEKALDRLWDINVDDHGWWQFIYDDAEDIGLKITEFNLSRNKIKGTLTESLLDSCKKIRKNHGKDTETFKTAKEYHKRYIDGFVEWRAQQEDDDYDDYTSLEMFDEFCSSDEAELIENDYQQAILEDFLVLLRKEHDYQTSEECIIESIKAWDYTFTENGKLVS
jgi:hypothetical protein